MHSGGSRAAPTTEVAHSRVKAGRLRAALSRRCVLLLSAAVLYPFLGFLSTNQGQLLAARSVAFYAGAAVLCGLALHVALVVSIKSIEPERCAAALAVFIVLFFNYQAWTDAWGSFGPGLEGPWWSTVAVWLAVALCITRIAYLLAQRKVVRSWLTLTLLLLCTLYGFLYLTGSSYSFSSEPPASIVDLTTSAGYPDAVRRPNVYLFLVDGYARSDVLEELTGFDNAEFERQLTEQDFVVADRAYASFPTTILSTMTMLQMASPRLTPSDFRDGIDPYQRFVQGDNAATVRFSEHGYTVVHAPMPEYDRSQCDPDYIDVCIETGDPLVPGELELALLRMTPASEISALLPSRTEPGDILEALDAALPSEPFFLYAHLYTPHWPYYFNDDCTPRQERLYPSEFEEWVGAYLADLTCLNHQLIESFRQIIAEDPQAMITLVSDHGSEFLTDWDLPLAEWSDRALRERFGVINALRLPEVCQEHVHSDTHLHGTLEVIFACLEGREPDVAPLRPHLWRHDDPRTVEEIPVERLESPSSPSDGP